MENFDEKALRDRLFELRLQQATTKDEDELSKINEDIKTVRRVIARIKRLKIESQNLAQDLNSISSPVKAGGTKETQTQKGIRVIERKKIDSTKQIKKEGRKR